MREQAHMHTLGIYMWGWFRLLAGDYMYIALSDAGELSYFYQNTATDCKACI